MDSGGRTRNRNVGELDLSQMICIWARIKRLKTFLFSSWLFWDRYLVGVWKKNLHFASFPAMRLCSVLRAPSATDAITRRSVHIIQFDLSSCILCSSSLLSEKTFFNNKIKKKLPFLECIKLWFRLFTVTHLKNEKNKKCALVVAGEFKYYLVIASFGNKSFEPETTIDYGSGGNSNS